MYRQCQGCWWPNIARSQMIRQHGVDLVFQNNPVLATKVIIIYSVSKHSNFRIVTVLICQYINIQCIKIWVITAPQARLMSSRVLFSFVNYTFLRSNLQYKSPLIQNLNVSRLVLQLSLCQPWEPVVKSRMKMQLEQRRQAMLQLHLSDKQFHYILRCVYIRDLTVIIGTIWLYQTGRKYNRPTYTKPWRDLALLCRW